jgi:hypothetical protein
MLGPISTTGNSVSGLSAPLLGTIDNINVMPGQYDSIDVTYDYNSINPTEHEVGFYVDGFLNTRLADTESAASASGLAEGLHTVDFHANRIESSWPDRHGDIRGQRGYVTWERSSDTSTVEYRVYVDSESEPSAIINNIVIQEQQYFVTQNSGGRLSSFGSYNGVEPINDELILLFGSVAGEVDWSIGALSGTEDFSTGESVLFPHGIWVEFHDDPADYEDGASFTVSIGPANEFLAGIITPGTHTFEITALDAAGNESNSSDGSCVIQDIPDSVTNVVFDYDAGFLTVSWDDDLSGNDVYVYSNYNTATGLFEDSIIREYPHEVVDMSTPFGFVPASDGQLKFYLRPYITEIRQDTNFTMHTFNFPPTPEDVGLVLGTPAGLTATAIADGMIRFEWDYSFQPEDDLDSFEIFDSVGSPAFDYETPTDGLGQGGGSGFPVAHYSIELGPYTDGVTVYFNVRSISGTVSTLNTAYVSAVSDATPPTLPGVTHAVSQ